MIEKAFAEALDRAERLIADLAHENERMRRAVAEIDVERLGFLLANLSGYADLFEDAADAIEGHRQPDERSEFNAGLLRGLADRLRELKQKPASGGG